MDHHADPGAAATTAEALVRQYFVCLDTEDWVTMRELWHPRAELRAVGARPRRGLDEVVGYFSKLFTPWPQHVDQPTRLIQSGDTIVAEVTFSGTTPDGLEVTFDAIDIFDIEDRLIRRMSNWYDIAYARRVLTNSATPSGAASEA
jgi:ketosteroid isomerase-like protein